jgi:hypothetical protein
MTPTAPPPDLPILVPNPDDIRAAIDIADERARLLRRLLRLALRLRLHLTTADRLPATVPNAKGVACVG